MYFRIILLLVFVLIPTMSASTLGRAVRKVVNSTRTTEGGGFPVRRPIPHTFLGEQFDPFLLLDHVGPVYFPPQEAIGAPDHPHRGFETVSYMLEGEIDHLDSFGHAGRLRSGGVQWMTAGSGLVHSEMPSTNLFQNGGTWHGFQIWVNLPAKSKMMKPRYQELEPEQIPLGTSEDGKVTVRVISGNSLNVQAKIETITPIVFLDVRMEPGAKFVQPIPDGYNALLYLYSGEAIVGSQSTSVNEGQAAIIDTNSSQDSFISIQTDASNGAKFLLLAGEPIKEPIARYGPFVMNTRDEIQQAFRDFQEGKMGELAGEQERMWMTQRAKQVKAKRLQREAEAGTSGNKDEI